MINATARTHRSLQEELDIMRDIVSRYPLVSQKELARQLKISTGRANQLCGRYAEYIGWTSNAAERQVRVCSMIRRLIWEKPEISQEAIARELNINAKTVRKHIREHPGWGWEGGETTRKRRHTEPVSTERELYEIQRTAEREGFGANNYGAFMVSINYDWTRYKRRRRQQMEEKR